MGRFSLVKKWRLVSALDVWIIDLNTKLATYGRIEFYNFRQLWLKFELPNCGVDKIDRVKLIILSQVWKCCNPWTTYRFRIMIWFPYVGRYLLKPIQIQCEYVWNSQFLSKITFLSHSITHSRTKRVIYKLPEICARIPLPKNR